MPLKELFNKIELDIEDEMRSIFALSYFNIGKVEFCGEIIIAFVSFNDLSSLKKQWKEFNSYLTVKYISTIKDEYSKWNFYIFYFSKDMIEKTLKYEIANNKFSSRKIVIENVTSELEINKIISEHITNDSIQVDIENIKVTEFIKDGSLSKIIDMLPKTKKIDEVELQNALELLEKNYKNEI